MTAASTLPAPLGRVVREPHAAKVPEVVAVFWLVKILTTGGGEAGSDYLARFGNVGGGGTVLLVFLAGLVAQLATRRYQAAAYWLFAYSIAIFGCAVADFLHLDLHLSYYVTTILWAVVLAAVFATWHRVEGTLSIHTITTARREAFYWSAVFATFALGTALGDLTALTFHWGYLPSALVFLGLIVLPGIAWKAFGLNPVAAFWSAYVVTRPLGASVADWIAKPKNATGLGVGEAPTLFAFTAAVLLLVVYLSVARPDVQPEPESLL